MKFSKTSTITKIKKCVNIILILTYNFSGHLKEQMIKYIDGSLDEVPINNNPLPVEMADIFYLIADHHFKNKTWV